SVTVKISYYSHSCSRCRRRCRPWRGSRCGGWPRCSCWRGGWAKGGYIYNIGVATRAVPVICPHPIVIYGGCIQAGNDLVRHIAHVQIAIACHIIRKRTVGSHIQPITGGAGTASPIGSETVTGYKGRRIRYRRGKNVLSYLRIEVGE